MMANNMNGLLAAFALIAATPAAGQTAGDVFRDCDDCPEMVVLPGGRAAIGRYEVTVGEFRVFADEAPEAAPRGPCGGSQIKRRRSWRSPGYLQTPRHPVACVSWNDAQAYTAWLTRKTGLPYRLPDEDEWDLGAAGSPKGCNTFFTKERGTCVVGTYPPSDAGVYGMAGNLREWTADCWDSRAPIRNGGDCGRQVVRGAGWAAQYWRIRADARRLFSPDLRSGLIGFRVARTLR